MNDLSSISLVTVNWNQRPCVELLLKSYVKHHYIGYPLRLMLYDNGSTDGSKEWLNTNDIPFFDGRNNIGHENALNVIYNDIKTKYCLLNDTDVEYKGNVYFYIDKMNEVCISVGEMIDKNFMNDIHIKDRISPWFWLFDIYAMRNSGMREFRDPKVEDWTYDVGSYHWEKMKDFGFANYDLMRQPGHQDNDLVSMNYLCFDHIGKVSWDLENHGDRYSEVMRRRIYVKERLELYKDIDLKGKFIQ